MRVIGLDKLTIYVHFSKRNRRGYGNETKNQGIFVCSLNLPIGCLFVKFVKINVKGDSDNCPEEDKLEVLHNFCFGE